MSAAALPSPPRDVFDVLSQSRARLHRRAMLGDGLSVAHWSNSFDATRYLPGHHTLSLYLRGGHGTYREDAPSERGGPGKLCLMPAGQAVNWVVWIVGRRIERAAALLRSRRPPSLEEVARVTGHASASHLVRRFKAVWGMTPGQYRAAAGSSRPA